VAAALAARAAVPRRVRLRPAPGRRPALALVLVTATLLIAALAAVAVYQGSRRGYVARKGDLVAARLTPIATDAISSVAELELRSSTGLRVHALVRTPRAERPPYPAAVLIGGAKRGRRVAIVPGLDAVARRALIVSPDYPATLGGGHRDALALTAAIPRLRSAAFEMVAQVGLLLDYLETRGDVAADRRFLVGSSLGAPAVVVAGALDERPAAVVALYGGGRVSGLVARALEHETRAPHPRWRAVALGHALAWLLAPLAPERYAPLIAPRQFLMVNGADDSLVPPASALALYEAAREPKTLVWVRGEHVQPRERELVERVATAVVTWLVSRGLLPGDGAADGGPPAMAVGPDRP
jgi:fermentation-respiration switch protein FrsA (DUF1100 family)